MEKEKRTEIELYWIRYILRYITVVHFTCVREGLVPNHSRSDMESILDCIYLHSLWTHLFRLSFPVKVVAFFEAVFLPRRTRRPNSCTSRSRVSGADSRTCKEYIRGTTITKHGSTHSFRTLHSRFHTCGKFIRACVTDNA